MQSSLSRGLPGINADSGAVYRALSKLEDNGEVTSEWETSEPGPARHVYQITQKGRASLKEWENDIRRRRAILDHFLEEYGRLIELKGERSAHED